MNRILLSATIALSAALAVGPATAQPPHADALYYYFYEDQNGEGVGHGSDECHYYGITRATHMFYGVKTAQFTTEIWAYCRNGQLSLD